MSRIVELPPELLDQIACFIDAREDIISFALACNYFFTTLSQTHLQYRDIRGPLCLVPLWKRLAEDVRSASLVRSLTILPEDSWDLQSVVRDSLPLDFRLPTEYREYDPGPDSRRYDSVPVNAALKLMVNLRRFRWFRVPPPVCEEGNDLWRTLGGLGTVRDLHVLDLHDLDLPDWPTVVSSPSFLSLSGLSSLDLRTDALDYSHDEPDLTPLLRMLVNNCPNLVSLRIHLQLFSHDETASAHVLVQDGQWSNLARLYLEGLNCQPSDLSSFLCRHPTLEELRLPCMMPGYRWAQLALPPGNLQNLLAPRLGTLHDIDLNDTVCLSDYFHWDFEWEEEHDINTEDLVQSPWKRQLLQGISSHPTITSVGLANVSHPSQLLELAGVAPQLTQLSLDLDISIDPQSERQEQDWLRALSHFHHLEHIIWYGYLQMGDYGERYRCFQDEQGTKIRRLLEVCPTLREIGDPWRKAVVIHRAGGVLTWVKRHQKDSGDPVIRKTDEVYTVFNV
ncbi:hypothetical protein GLOTRDRAFT_134038 [Gloeophyllum trabeum ATCC 11539]|uniref:F-box domain-containing protein n=1 Tax=Gloeophyllum trabeum (strain ATCC 11539 / FP-39264 / Madison 617) TaxID=670483 RepID=S7PSK7_GLOTA|nr:uncharacterized protein GLOTRDRAFT_134038 [Gloeophyllum trabeum ATCC 11539]EPQ50372.1 hypothetical protein GLOTRDRAFT_134038 [Gloeophyllum trabeum ATCC 11539]